MLLVNNSDGCNYSGAAWMNGFTISSGVPACGHISAYPYNAAKAFGTHLQNILDTVDDKGLSHFGL